MKNYDMFWATNSKWWHFDENYNRILNDDAPNEAKESYNRYCKQLKLSSEVESIKAKVTEYSKGSAE